LIYLYIPGAEFSAFRVRQRVKQGGHDIPLDDIIRRYPRSIKNLFAYAGVCDRTFCFDNKDGNVKPVFEKEKGRSAKIFDQITYARITRMAGHE